MCYALTHEFEFVPPGTESEAASEQESFEQAINDDPELPEEEQGELDVFKRVHIHIMPKSFLKDLHSTASHSPSEAVNIKNAKSKAEKLDNDKEMSWQDIFLTDEFAKLADSTEETSERASDDMDIDGEPSELLTAKMSHRRRFIDDIRGNGPNWPHLHETQYGIEESSNKRRRLGRTKTPTKILEGFKSDGRLDETLSSEPSLGNFVRESQVRCQSLCSGSVNGNSLIWYCCSCRNINHVRHNPLCSTCHHRRCANC